MNTNQKGFANIILVVVIVVLLGAVGYFAFVKKSEPITKQEKTTDWKNFTSNEYEYTFKYPKENRILYPDLEAYPGSTVFLNTIKVGINDDYFDSLFKVEAVIQPKGNEDSPPLYAPNSLLNLKDFATKLYQINKEDSSRSGVEGNLQTIKVDNIEAYEFTVTKGFLIDAYGKGNIIHMKRTYVFASDSGGQKFVISFPVEASVSHQILSTFEFTKKNETANWKIYRNDKYGFEIKYPMGWTVEVADRASGGGPIIVGFYFSYPHAIQLPNGGSTVDQSAWGIQIFNKNNVTNDRGTKIEHGDKAYVIFNEGLRPELFTRFLSTFKFTK